MFCTRCGFNNREGSVFCVKCGQRLSTLASGNQVKSNGLENGCMLQGRYRIVKRLGRGGMGVVYLANDNRFSNRFCVVKEMMELLFSDYERQKAIARFNHEADLLASINHPNIPQVYDRFSECNRHYLVMEFVEGMDLKDLLKQHMSRYNAPLPEEHIMVYFMQLCNTLKYLHNHKPIIFHRDIKPSNILLTFDGKAKLIDFGIAKAIHTNSLGTSVGTRGYAAPEQYKGLADSRTDIYSLGATMHHIVTGRDPQHETQFDYPPAKKIADVSQGLSDIIDWMLQTDINKRPQQIENVIDKIKEISQDIEQKVLNYPVEGNYILNLVASGFKTKDEEMPSKIFCVNCGVQNKTDSRFCLRCGRPLSGRRLC